ncbi:Methuselah, N-terminal domain [Sergentomyia squamirostris]
MDALATLLALVLLQWSPVASQALVRDSPRVPCPFFDTVNITDGEHLSNGSILYDGIVYPPDLFGEYDYELVNQTTKYSVEPHLRGCICEIKKTCVKYCCPKNFAYRDGACSGPNPSNPILINMRDNEGNVSYNVIIEEKFGIVYGKPCSHMYRLEPEEYPDDAFFLLPNGHIITAENDRRDKNQYCIAHMYPEVETNETQEVGDLETRVFMCFPSQDEAKFFIYPIGMLLSVPFLVITFLVYAIIPELRNLHGKSLMCYVFGLTVGYVFLSVIHLQVPLSPFGCVFMGFTAYFSFLTSFFWLNVMCIDIWWAFRGVRGNQKDEERRKYIIYSLYAWGCSLTMLTISLVMQFTEAVPVHMRPGIGDKSCWLKGEKITEFMYLYFPVIILISINVILFTLTSIQIRRMQKEAAVMNKGDSRRFNKMEADRDRFSLYLRLFIVMGVTWAMEVISWLVDPQSWVFYISDIGNCLQGFFIFMLFVWKPKIKKLIIKRRLKRSASEMSQGTIKSHALFRDDTGLFADFRTPAKRRLDRAPGRLTYQWLPLHPLVGPVL